jgi:phosphoribosylanthranilate isomerase
MNISNGRQATRVKICGFTRVEDAVTASALGVDAIGLVFYPPSPRHVDIEQAAEIAAVVSPFCTVTALFLDADAAYVDKVLQAVPVSLLQFHGTESAQYCESFSRPYIKSVAMKSVDDVAGYCAGFAGCRGFLLDSNAAGAAGGSGTAFDWSLVPAELASTLILAGGLYVDNVADAIRAMRPAAVDVSSGVESAKGVKDEKMMRDFITNVRMADSEHHPE